MNSRISFENGNMTVYLSGEIDHHAAKKAREIIDSLIQQKKPSELRMDFSAVSFMDSSGIGLIMGRYRMMMLYGGTVRITHVPEGLDRMMELSGLGALDIIEKKGELYESAK